MSGKRRAVFVYDDDIGGASGLFIDPPTEYHAEVRLIPVALLDAREHAENLLRDAEQAIREAWAAASPRRNPRYLGYDDD